MPGSSPLTFDYLLLRFIVYAFIGWVLESSYKTFGQRRGFINSGFLHGPIIPIYGFGAVMMIALERKLAGLSLPLQVLSFTVLCTAFEYSVGLLYEAIFKIKLWDYSGKRFNIHGRVCLKNTILWALLVLAFLLFIEPAINNLVALLPAGPALRWAAYAVGALALCDAAWSSSELKSTAEILNRFREKLALGEPESLRKAMKSMGGRFMAQFPNLRKIAGENLQTLIAETIGERGSETLLAQVAAVLKGEAAADAGYDAAVSDLLAHERVRAMAGIEHHSSSILDHSLKVSRIAYLVSQRFGLDARSAARGGLLHDFFLYDWRREKVRHHATGHARTALENARRHFSLNEVEADCILTHMWPLSRRFYRYRESFVVSMADKLVSAREMTDVDFPELVKQLIEKRLPR
jgi:Predicted membrane protein